MSILSAFTDGGDISGFEEVFKVTDITTPAMKAAIKDWAGLYTMSMPTDTEDPCQRIPVAVVSKLQKTVFSEYEATAQNSDFAKKVLNGLAACRKKGVQQAFIGGESFLKPLINKGNITFRVIPRTGYVVLERDNGVITSIGTQEETECNGFAYTLYERRTVDEDGFLTIESKLFKSAIQGGGAGEVSLSVLPKYAHLEPVFRLPKSIGSIGLIPIRCPAENVVDGSDDAVSVYAAAAGLIHNINVNEMQINKEFENGRSRIIASGDLLERDKNGRRSLSDDVFTALDDDPELIGINIFSPALREQSFLARKNEYLRNIETLIGMKRGILSEVEASERTATEITSSAGDYNLTIKDFQEMWESSVREAVRVCEALAGAYSIPTGAKVNPDDIVIDWGNGILYDEEKEWADRKEMVAAGLLKPEIAVAWRFNEPWDTPEDLAAIREKYMPELESLTEGE